MIKTLPLFRFKRPFQMLELVLELGILILQSTVLVKNFTHLGIASQKRRAQ